MATTFIIPEYTSLERGPLASIQGLAANEAAAADELGGLFSMVVARSSEVYSGMMKVVAILD
jgi:hypothetical protein